MRVAGRWKEGHWRWRSLWLHLVLMIDVTFVLLDTVAAVPLTEYIRHYEPISYNRHDFHEHHLRARRSVEQAPLRLHLEAHGKTFKIRLRREAGLFSPDLVVENSTGPIYYDTTRAYVGHLEGEPLSSVHGVVTLDGLFEGKITTMEDQYMIERAWRYFTTPQPFHSIMYKHSDVHMDSLNESLCMSDKLHQKLHNIQSEETQRRSSRSATSGYIHDFRSADAYYSHKLPPSEKEGAHKGSSENHHQHRRAVDAFKTTCTLYVQADHLFYQKFGSNEEAVIEQLTQHVQGVNEIYKIIDFDGDSSIDNINFIIKRIKVHTDPSDVNYKYSGNYGVESFLELFSEDNFDAFCLAYMFTYRDFDGGTLGLAWTGDLTNAGGVCERNGQFRGALRSLNSGIVTILNYGKDVPSTVSHVTMAHEMGHNMGSQHDPETTDCSPGGEYGNYIMFARATSGDKPNNNKFSTCSKVSMSEVMEVKARTTDGCFIEATNSICGNGVVEWGEECDCGWEDQCTDSCCYPQTDSHPEGTPCTLTPTAACSPSQGPCCSPSCQLIDISQAYVCREATECRDAGYCNGSLPSCPESFNMPDKTICEESSVCFSGECTGSICLAYSLEPCQCDPVTQNDFTDEKLCKLCCQLPGDDASCKPSDEWNDAPFDVPDLMSKSGAPCYNYEGYCDVFHKCREVDPNGPLSSLSSLFSPAGIEDMKNWLSGNWYIPMSGFFGFIILMAIFIKVCSPKKKQKGVGPQTGALPPGATRRPPPGRPPSWAQGPPPGMRPPPGGARATPPGARQNPSGSRPQPGVRPPALGPRPVGERPPLGVRPPPAGTKAPPYSGHSPPPVHPGKRLAPMDDWV